MSVCVGGVCAHVCTHICVPSIAAHVYKTENESMIILYTKISVTVSGQKQNYRICEYSILMRSCV